MTKTNTKTTTEFPTIDAPGIGPREAKARVALDASLGAQAEVRELLAVLRADLASAVVERDRLDAVIGTADEDADAFTRLGDADTRVTSLERRIARAEEDAEKADFGIRVARNTVDTDGHAHYWEQFFAQEDVFYGHVLGFKGLERPAVVLCVNGIRDEDRAAKMLYTGISRATTKLIVVGDLEAMKGLVPASQE